MAFLFYPECDITQPSHPCSHAWVMYFLFAVYSMLSFQNFLLIVPHYGCLLLATLYFSIGLPWYEILWHLGFGYAAVLFLQFSFADLSDALKIKLNFFTDLSKLFRISLGFLLFFATFYNVDYTIPENGTPYGLAIAMVFCFMWILIAGAFFFCMENVKTSSVEKQGHYWIFWIQLFVSALVAFCVAFIPSLCSYYKSMIAAPSLTAILYLHKSHHKSLEMQRKQL